MLFKETVVVIFRMDEDQCTRKNYQLLFNRRDPDYYEFEGINSNKLL